MYRIKLFENWWEDKKGLIMYPSEIEDYFIEYIDQDSIKILNTDENFCNQEDLKHEFSGAYSKIPIYHNNYSVEKYSKEIMDNSAFMGETYLLVDIYHPKFRSKGNLDLNGYTRDTISYLFRKFVRISGWIVNIDLKILRTDMYSDPLSHSIIRIQFVKKNI